MCLPTNVSGYLVYIEITLVQKERGWEWVVGDASFSLPTEILFKLFFLGETGYRVEVSLY